MCGHIQKIHPKVKIATFGGPHALVSTMHTFSCTYHTHIRRTFPQKSSFTAFGGPRALVSGEENSKAGSIINTSDIDALIVTNTSSPRSTGNNTMHGGTFDTAGGEDVTSAFLNDPMWDDIEQTTPVDKEDKGGAL